MSTNNYIPQNISSKTDISLYLANNIESYKEEAKSILENSGFSISQKQDLENIMRQYYYALNDLVKAIDLLSK